MNIEGRSFLLFGGKGGNGKTTSACATALYLARERPEQKIMIVSTDPAHSVGDSFDCTLGSSITPIEGVENLWALELAAEEEADRFREQHSEVMKKIVERGTWLDRQDIDGFFSLTLPGLDEVMAIIRIANLLRDGEFDVIIVDTAPTGHTMKLLAMPGEMEKWVSVLRLMQSKHRFLAKQFTGRYRKDDADEFLQTIRKDLKRVRTLLKNPRSTLFIPVVIPEDLPVTETENLLSVLKKYGIATRYIIVNRVKRGGGTCPYCSVEAADQEKWMAAIREKFSKSELCEVPAFPYEIHGLERLREYGDYLFGEKSEPAVFRLDQQPAGQEELVSCSESLKLNVSEAEISFIIFGGKGGVGKTSLAAAAALHLAARHPTKKVLIFSTDPAHSLSESFDTPIGESAVQIVPELNLFGIEINAEKLLADFQKDYKESISALFGGFVGLDIRFDRAILEELVSANPPGLDEIMALGKVMEFVDEHRFDIYVFDPAATGHLLNFLAMPELVREWLKMVFRLQIKYQSVIDLSPVAENLLDLSKKMRRVQRILTDPERCEFIAVTIPEIMGIKELDRLLRGITDLKIPGSNVVVNMVRPDIDCHFCQVKRHGEHQLIKKLIREKQPDYQITQVPLFNDQIKGIKSLNRSGEVLYA
ncbi:ArsA family ATPase [Acidobacteria bacterium AH-259-A15]|nr:ArsA family ATPase [Acidobacteria bacterium AH-259-A15]MDA2936915.1 ArsA family ATPase [Acidobacteria bacterium AH-259-A15]